MLEKIARDVGFDPVPRREAARLVCCSSQFGETALVRTAHRSQAVIVALTARSRMVGPASIRWVSNADIAYHRQHVFKL